MFQVNDARKPEMAKHVVSSTVYLVASGDQRLDANQTTWPAQEAMEKGLVAAFKEEGVEVTRAHKYRDEVRHGFIDSQRMGLDVFSSIPKDAAVVVACSVWQYTYHVLGGLFDHKGPVLTVANWSGENPGLVGLLNLNASMTKAGLPYSTLWSKDFKDAFFVNGLREWIRGGRIIHDASHIVPFERRRLPSAELDRAYELASDIRHRRMIMGVFDEGCMGMYNAIIDDALLNMRGIFKERLSQSALLAEMRLVGDVEAKAAKAWLDEKGMTFKLGTDERTELTVAQVVDQLKMYIAMARMASRFSCDVIGIQYQLGMKDVAPASDLAEGLLNNKDRPPVHETSDPSSKVLFEGLPIVCFNEADECAGLDALITNRVWTAGLEDPATTLHDVRYGEEFGGQFVWVLEISGSAPASHFTRGYADASSERQPPMYFPLGGGTLKGISKPGEIVWSRIYVVDQCRLMCDIGRGTVQALPAEETKRRWEITTPQWPIMHAVLHNVSRDQLMANHKANHIQVVYASTPEKADELLRVKGAVMELLGIPVQLCGVKM